MQNKKRWEQLGNEIQSSNNENDNDYVVYFPEFEVAEITKENFKSKFDEYLVKRSK